MSTLLYPAIDVRDGRVVRLQQGDYARETRYADDPFELASRYAAHGATWLHLVDLDAARDGGYAQLDLLARIKAATSLKVQTGGGIRDEAGVDALFAAGVDRVVVGSLAIREPERVMNWLCTLRLPSASPWRWMQAAIRRRRMAAALTWMDARQWRKSVCAAG